MKTETRKTKPPALPPAWTSCPACGVVVDKAKLIEHLQGCDSNRRSGI